MSSLITTGDDINQLVNRLDAMADSIDVAIQACVPLDDTTRGQWEAWRKGFKKFAKDNKDHFTYAIGLSGVADQATSYENELNTWNKRVAQICKTLLPDLVTQQEASSRNSLFNNIDFTKPFELATGTKLLIGGGVALALLVAWKVKV